MITKDKFIKQYTDTDSLDTSKMADVLKILQNVKMNKDAAIKQYNEQFDGVSTPILEVPQADIKAAYDQVDASLLKDLMQAYENILTYQRKIKYRTAHNKDEMYQVYHPLNAVGIYVPGGKASYPSSVLMTATLAQVAGVKEIIVVTPPQIGGINPIVLACCYITGVTRIFQVGGAQAIAALTYGTESIPKVDKIVGPGNQYVALAKKLVFGEVGIDSIAGPSEIAIAVDEYQNPTHIAYDCMAQAEHDELARTFVVSTSESILLKIEDEIARLINEQPRKEIIKESIKNHHYSILTNSIEENFEVLNLISSEHVSIQTADAQKYIEGVNRAGALFIGPYAPEAMGDYVLGPSHVLPTNGNARFINGLTVNDFLTSNSVMDISKATFKKNMDAAINIAQAESLFAHAASIQIRKDDLT
ncbi:histidinol dehydrogenase [Macrococcus animalis]|uniref:histidinol dehydrogenase n=1 Tax=Macrococcus animalis TaxID=3395467 RepID=UPI0039BFAD7E